MQTQERAGLGLIRLYIAEEQQLLREAYHSFFRHQPDVEVVGVSGDADGESLAEAAHTFNPRVMLLGFKALQMATVSKLAMLRERCPQMAMVLLSASYDIDGIKALREFASRDSVGCAYLLKYSIDTEEQLVQVVHGAAEGRIILDPLLMKELIASGEPKAAFLKELTPRELEVLGWMSRGYRNTTIAEVLCLEPKTVERHINSIYGKLGNVLGAKHARVHAVTLYLRATGLLSAMEVGDGQAAAAIP